MAREENPYPGRKRSKGPSIRTYGESFKDGVRTKLEEIKKPKPSPPPPPKR